MKNLILLLLLILPIFSFNIQTNTIQDEHKYNLAESVRLAHYASLAFCDISCLSDWSCGSADIVKDFTDVIAY